MNLYSLLKMATGNKFPIPVKMLGLAALFRLRRRTAGVFLDPVLACNLRCKMCYFSDPEKRASMKGIISDPELYACAESVFPYALKLQIGCGAEPTLYPDLIKIIHLGKQYKVPYISLTSNGQLLGNGRHSLADLAEAGLNELTLSLHGTTPEVYEELMPVAKFGTFKLLTEQIAAVKSKYPDFKLRVNYTVNSLNVLDLQGTKFWDLWQDSGYPDIVQMRPVQNMGDTEWKDFDPEPLLDKYDTTIGAIVSECERRGILCIAPTRGQILEVAAQQDGTSAIIEDLTYVYVAPGQCYKEDFNPATETFAAYHKRLHSPRRLVKAAFRPSAARARNASKKLNYTIK